VGSFTKSKPESKYTFGSIGNLMFKSPECAVRVVDILSRKLNLNLVSNARGL
jgi:hypothetical protein